MEGFQGCSKRAQITSFVLVLMIVLAYALPLSEWTVICVSWTSRQPLLLGGTIYAIIYAITVILGLPAMVLNICAGFVWKTLIASVLSTIGATSGSVIAFALGQKVLRSTAQKMVEKWPKFALIDAAIAQGGWKIILLLRLSPLTPYNILNYTLALTQVNVWTFAWSSFIGMLPQTIALCYTGAAASDLSSALSEEGDPSVLFYTLAVAAVSTLLVTWVVQREINKVLAKSERTKKQDDGNDDIPLV